MLASIILLAASASAMPFSFGNFKLWRTSKPATAQDFTPMAYNPGAAGGQPAIYQPSPLSGGRGLPGVMSASKTGPMSAEERAAMPVYQPSTLSSGRGLPGLMSASKTGPMSAEERAATNVYTPGNSPPITWDWRQKANA